MMNWGKLLSTARVGKKIPFNNLDTRSEFHKDYDRIVFCSAFRRLGRKTQVHPLSNNDHIHTRLTHSIEVGSVGRSLGENIGQFLESINELPQNISPQDIAAIVQSACLAHDIGNPPFGHAGEYAIRHWFRENGSKLFIEKASERSDLEMFEGNAQGFRVVAAIENNYDAGGLRLTYATLGTLIKYPWFSDDAFAKESGKFNFFQTEKGIAEQVARQLGLACDESVRFSRHPLSYLMEAADDICYTILDIEDALELNMLKFEDVSSVFNNLAGKENEFYSDLGAQFSSRRRIMTIRSKAIENLINRCTEIFKKFYPAIMSGHFEGDLISKIDGVEAKGIEKAKKITNENIFLNRRKIELELGSYATLDTILSAFIDAANEVKKGQVSFKSRRVMDLMGVNSITSDMTHHLCYLRITDMVSGMTDSFATHVANQLSGRAV